MTTAIRPAQAPRTSLPRPRTSRFKPGRALAWVYLVIIILVTIFPFYWMIRTALSNNYALNSDPSSFFPVGFTWGAFQRVLGLQSAAASQAEGGSGASIDLLLYIRNSVIYATIETACQVFFAAIAAYAFSRLHWRGRDIIFNIFFAALVLPSILTLLPNFLTIKDLGLLNSFAGLILPGAFFSAFNIFFLRQFFLGLSSEIEEAALLDGASRLRILFQVTFPLASGPITTLSILGFITQWNEYFWPLITTTSADVQPLTLGLAIFKQSSPGSATDWAGLMAAALVAALPMLLLFIAFGRRIVDSIGFSGSR